MQKTWEETLLTCTDAALRGSLPARSHRASVPKPSCRTPIGGGQPELTRGFSVV